MKFLYGICLFIIYMLVNPVVCPAQEDFDDFFEPKTTIGGYGELHYNYENSDNNNAKETLDFHRFVLYVSHAWSEEWSFRSELELEHNFVKEGQGEFQLEQAFLNYNHAPWLSLQAGVLLAASGFINEYHEPVNFLSVERPEYAKYIIPSTWFGNGIGAYGFYSGIDYRMVILEGLDGSKIGPSSAIRDARQKGYKSNAEKLLYNLRLDYVNIPGLRLGGSISTNNAVVSDSTSNSITILECHARYQSKGIYSAFEYGNISYGTGDLRASMGYYFDLGYDIGQIFDRHTRVVPWVRYTNYNTSSQNRAGSESEKIFHYKKWMIGLAVFPIKNVVLKMDYGSRERQSDGQETTFFNLGFGYNFE